METSTLTQPKPTVATELKSPTPNRLYDSFGMNPRIIRFYLAEKGLELS